MKAFFVGRCRRFRTIESPAIVFFQNIPERENSFVLRRLSRVRFRQPLGFEKNATIEGDRDISIFFSVSLHVAIRIE